MLFSNLVGSGSACVHCKFLLGILYFEVSFSFINLKIVAPLNGNMATFTASGGFRRGLSERTSHTSSSNTSRSNGGGRIEFNLVTFSRSFAFLTPKTPRRKCQIMTSDIREIQFC